MGATIGKSLESSLRQAREELQTLFDGSTEGIVIVEAESRRFVRANRAVCELLGYTSDELSSLSMADVHPAESLRELRPAYEAVCKGRLKSVRNVPFLRKDGRVVRFDIAASFLTSGPKHLLVFFFRDITEQNRAIELLRASEERYRLIVDNVDDVIWTAPLALSDSERALAKENVTPVVDAVLDRFRLSFVSPAAERMLGYTMDDIARLSLRDLATSAGFAHIRDNMIAEFTGQPSGTEDGRRERLLEAELLAKDGSSRWCEIVSTYLRDEQGLPTGLLGITRDISRRRQTERALRESESKLRSLFENLPDIVVTVDRNANIHFINRNAPHITKEAILGVCGFNLVVPEHREMSRRMLEQAFATAEPQTAQLHDMFGRWWSIRVVSLAKEGDAQHALVICTDITQERLATEAVNKEQRLLRQLLELHERERRLAAYEIHDGFAQQLAGALFRLQGFRETHSRNSAKAWEDFDAAVRLVSQAIDETRRLISGLRPPILDESGIVHAIQYLVCECQRRDGPAIEFTHNVAFERLASPLESALFRITQESLQNACRHSHSDRICIDLTQRDGRVCLDIRDWGVGFSLAAVAEQRFGLQGIRERVRLLDGRVVIESAPGEGTHIWMELPLVGDAGAAEGAVNGRRYGDPCSAQGFMP